MDNKYSPKLRACMHEIAGVLEKHDVGGVVTLSDGQGMGEYRLFIDTPSWSNIRFVKDGSAIHFKAHAQSKPVETNKTVNMIWNQLDLLGNCFMMIDQIKKMVKDVLKVESSGGEMFHGPYDDDPKTDR